MLSTVPYSEVSGQRNIEWDSIMLCANFMKMWAMVPQVVKDMSGHHDSQEKLPDDTIDKLINSMYVFERSLNIFFKVNYQQDLICEKMNTPKIN